MRGDPCGNAVISQFEACYTVHYSVFKMDSCGSGFFNPLCSDGSANPLCPDASATRRHKWGKVSAKQKKQQENSVESYQWRAQKIVVRTRCGHRSQLVVSLRNIICDKLQHQRFNAKIIIQTIIPSQWRSRHHNASLLPSVSLSNPPSPTSLQPSCPPY